MKEDYHISFAQPHDLEQIGAINNAVIQKSTANYDWEIHPQAYYVKWFSQKKQLNQPVLVAKTENEVLGFGTYSQFRNKQGYQFCMEHSVYVKDDYQGKGVGSALLSRIIDHAKKQQIHVLVAGVDTSNEASIRFHQRFGFEVVGEMKQVGRKFDRWLDLTFLQLIVSK